MKNRYGYDGPEEFRPITPWGYVGYSLLFSVPVVGFIFLLIFTFSSKNIPRRCYARSFWCIALLTILFVVLAAMAFIAVYPEFFAELRDLFVTVSQSA